jgi:hypothetical protein
MLHEELCKLVGFSSAHLMNSMHLWLGLLLLQVELTDMETCTQQATTWQLRH